MARGNVFTCTFCRGISAGPPHVLGRSARLACEPCHSALLDLSICWVCGEMILRGDECVSLGWCFWHRACYGCLLCGCRRVCAGVPPQTLPAGADDAAVAGGREVAEPPLCAMCMTDLAADGGDEESMVRRGLRRISFVDGGVTRRRWWRRLQGQGGGGGGGQQRETGIKATGGDAGAASQRSDGAAVTTIWVDLHDPIDGFSFAPSPLKPVPPFMSPPAVGGGGGGGGGVSRLGPDPWDGPASTTGDAPKAAAG